MRVNRSVCKRERHSVKEQFQSFFPSGVKAIFKAHTGEGLDLCVGGGGGARSYRKGKENEEEKRREKGERRFFFLSS